jgi:pyridoxine/pyridoxamine 5'-phosphate oxidase
METRNLAELYELPALDWGDVLARLDQGFDQAPGSGGGPGRHTCWLATVDADGSPRLNGIGALWIDRTFWFETGESSVKGRNLARDPRCSLSVALDVFDVVVKGEAHLVTHPETVARLAAVWAEGGWPARPDESGTALTAEFSAPSAGPPPWAVYRMDVTAAVALATSEPGGATSWRF